MPRVIFVLYDGVQTLDLTGPAEVFAAARLVDPQRYEPIYAAMAGGGPRMTSAGLQVSTRDLARIRPQPSDIVMVPGGAEVPVTSAATDHALCSWLRRAARVVERLASVCSGAFVLANAGLLDGRRAATHWRVCGELQRMFPKVQVDANAIYVRDGNLWTSAGVTTGIDMALAMVELDLGQHVSDALARELVLYARRPGGQAQFSATLAAQTSSCATLRAGIGWLRDHLARASVAGFAKHAGLSERTLHRRCQEDLGTSPARLIARLRLEEARLLLKTTKLSTKVIATKCGFGSAARMSRLFARELDLTPREYRLLHAR